MRVLALTRYDRLGASSRIRIYQYLPTLCPLGVEVDVSPLLGADYIQRLYARQRPSFPRMLSGYFFRAVRLLSARRYDLLWIEKELFPNVPCWFEQALAAAGIPYVVDIDDAIFHNYDLGSNPYKRFLANKIEKVMRGSALMVCGNDYLAERARLAGASRVETLPTVIDMERYSVAPIRTRTPPVVGWVGSPVTLRYLVSVLPVLREARRAFPFRLRVIGADLPSTLVEGLDIECRPWSEDAEVQEIQDLDIGIMPLTDSPWERGKCGYKLIQYMACGLPVVASPVGVNQEIVTHGVNGYLADTPEAWGTALRTLCLDPGLAREMGTKGRATVEQRYCLQVTAPRLAGWFQDVVRQRRP